jgi:hemerythrin-like domain-containing protein
MLDLFEMAPTFNDPIGMLRACHRRIERALEVMARIAGRETEEALDAEGREALRRTLLYFNTGVPRHAADEEESLFPRLRAAARGAAEELLPHEVSLLATLRKLETLEREHVEADAAHRELDALGEVLLETGRFERSEDRARFHELITRLQTLYQEHIRVEDNELFPLAAQWVESGEQDVIGTEMAHRRGIDRGQHRELVAKLESRPWIHRDVSKEGTHR